MTEKQFQLELKKLLMKALDGGLDSETICAMAEHILESDDWSWTE
jgi:hypothetical protein